MKNISLNKEYSFNYVSVDWSISCAYKTLTINNNGIKLWARKDEGLKEIIFDISNKTISIVVNKPTLPQNAPRTVDLSSVPDFFDDIRDNIEKILIGGTYELVEGNKDRTRFIVK